MSERGSSVSDLPSALSEGDALNERLAGRRPAVFLDYDGTLSPIVDRPEDAVISESMREAVRALARRCTVCVVSGRDRPVVQELMGVDDLVVAGSHGFDIWSPDAGTLEHEASGGFDALLEQVTNRVRDEAGAIDGALIEPKKASVAVHYRLVSDSERPRIKALVDRLLAEHPDELRVTPGKLVYEIQPKLDWDKGKAVLHLLEALGLDREDIVRCTWATTLPTSTPSRPRRERASQSSSATLTIRRLPVARPQPTSSSARSRRSNDSCEPSHAERHGLHIGGSR
jgi:trehalose 6-phosphate phosphatase